MIWNSWGEFANMGGYALYVWGSCFVALGAMGAEVVLLIFRRRNILDHLGRFVGMKSRAGAEPSAPERGSNPGALPQRKAPARR